MSDEDPRISHTDREVFRSAATGEGLIPITSGEQLMELAQAAQATHDTFLSEVAELITDERAAFVRKLRVEEGYSWRAVAEACYLEWNGDWQPPSNQLMGMALCEHAANHYGEHYMDDTWNG